MVGAFSILALRREPSSAFFDIAELLFRVSLVGYWLYVVGVEFVEQMRSTYTHVVEARLASPVRSHAPQTTFLTAVAAVILAIASLIGAQIEMMDAGHPLIAMLTVLAGVIDAKILTDKAAQSDLLSR